MSSTEHEHDSFTPAMHKCCVRLASDLSKNIHKTFPCFKKALVILWVGRKQIPLHQMPLKELAQSSRLLRPTMRC